jgi:hypothetical protein
MRLEAALFGGLFIQGRFWSAGASNIDAIHGLHRRHANFHEQMRRDADSAVRKIEKRNDVFGPARNGVWPTVVVPPGFTLAAGVEITPIPGVKNTFVSPSVATVTPGPATPSSGVATPVPQAAAAAVASISPAEWNAQADTACMTAVMQLRGKSSNPAGLAVCYNVPYLDEAKGVFEAELRMYNVSAPTGDFVGVTPAMMMVTLQYQGATIQKSNGVLPVKRDSGMLVERQMSMGTPTGTAMPPSGAMPNGILMPSEVAVRKYVGQVNKALMVPGMNL